jgi:ketosteroid isomerase-like protein
MSQENVELVKSVQPTDVDLVELVPEDEDAGQAALSAVPAVFADDFAVQFIAARGMEQPEYRGGEGLSKAWRDWLLPWASYRIETEQFIDAGDQVVVLARVQGRTVRDGVTVEHSPAAIWSIREGKITGVRFYLERDEALEAAGLSQQDVQADSS